MSEDVGPDREVGTVKTFDRFTGKELLYSRYASVDGYLRRFRSRVDTEDVMPERLKLREERSVIRSDVDDERLLRDVGLLRDRLRELLPVIRSRLRDGRLIEIVLEIQFLLSDDIRELVEPAVLADRYAERIEHLRLLLFVEMIGMGRKS